MINVLEVKQLNIGFHKKPLINNLSFKIPAPAFIAVIGHNGCGKSTFLKSLMNLHPFSGSIRINDREIQSYSDLPKKGIMTLLEQRNHFNFSISVNDLIQMGRFRFTGLFHGYTKEDQKKVDEALDLIQISHLQNEDFLSLSGGEQQLVWLAQVLVQDTQIILLDEPTQQLDIYNRKKVFDLIQFWAYQRGKLIICITHDLSNLKETKGFYLNLSSENPVLEQITEEKIVKEIRFLEKVSA